MQKIPMIIKKEENEEVKKDNLNIYKYLMEGYKECMPRLSNSLLDTKYFDNNHFMNQDFEKNPKYFVAFDDSTVSENSIVTISALFVFPKYRRNGFAKDLIDILKSLSKNHIILQVAIYEDKYLELKSFYEKLDFKSTGKPCIADSLNIRYIDMFWCDVPMQFQHTNFGTAIKRLVNQYQ